jgi:hypothetical protein
MDFANYQGFTNNNGPTRYVVKPRQPIYGKRIIGAISTLCTYDIITPYGMGANVAANASQATLTMVGWGLVPHLSILCPGAATLTVQADLGDGTFTEVDFSPIALAVSAKVQFVDLAIEGAFFIRLRLAGDGSTYTYHASLTDY